MKPLSIECPNLTCIINQSQPEWYILIKYQAKSLNRNLALRSQFCRDSKADIAPKHFSVYLVKMPYTPCRHIRQFPLMWTLELYVCVSGGIPP